MADRDLTTGELEVKLDGIAKQLEAIANTMLTRQVFDVWNHGIDQRFTRLEVKLDDAIKDWAATKRDLESKIATLRTEHQLELDKAKTGLRADLKEIREDRETDKRDIEQFKRGRFNSVLLLLIGIPVAIVTTVITKLLWPG